MLAILYLVAGLALLAHAALQLDLLRRARAVRDDDGCPVPPPAPDHGAAPLVVVQLPLYNEVAVVERLLTSCAALDYPTDRLLVQVLDDSTDRTPDIVRTWMRDHPGTHTVHHIRRGHRAGYKAGALAHGLDLAGAAEFVAVLDADFVPPPDLLRCSVPVLTADPAVAAVQSRWSHLNQGESWLTRAQAAMLDAYFAVEQRGRAALGGAVAFNGSAGVLRATAIRAVGGWSSRTLTEDFDLSVRLQHAGHRVVFLPALRSQAELPRTVAAVRSQQHRWMRGVAQNSRRYLGATLRADLPARRRAHFVGQLAESTGFVALALQVILAPAVALAVATGEVSWWLAANVPMAAAFLALVPVYVHASRDAGQAPREAAVSFVQFLALTGGLTFANAIAVGWGWTGRPAPFVRTPKWGDRHAGRAPSADTRPRPRVTSAAAVEATLAAVAVLGAVTVVAVTPHVAVALWPQASWALGSVALVVTARSDRRARTG